MNKSNLAQEHHKACQDRKEETLLGVIDNLIDKLVEAEDEREKAYSFITRKNLNNEYSEIC